LAAADAGIADVIGTAATTTSIIAIAKQTVIAGRRIVWMGTCPPDIANIVGTFIAVIRARRTNVGLTALCPFVAEHLALSDATWTARTDARTGTITRIGDGAEQPVVARIVLRCRATY
jgi:hypothetical protein